ncbi:hypothetical protein [Inediibacterium massiliense]|uniref:hypothetical protein n=1 Tax=Inediibacterium massiliense TaxID=1658111 RepID=UPI0006B47302|nr:hypothetical protein [Inediibacterium massiliense]
MFTGKLDGYFLRLKDEEEIPPITFHLYQFERGFDKTIIFYHKSQVTIMIGTKIVPQNVRCTLEYKTKNLYYL